MRSYSVHGSMRRPGLRPVGWTRCSGRPCPAVARLLSRWTAGTLGLLAVLLASAGAAHAQQTTTLHLGLPISFDSPTGQNLREFARQVRARTSGALTIDLTGNGRSYTESEVLSGVATGAIDIGATSLNQVANDVPLAKAFLQPFLFNFDALVQAATGQESEIRTLIDKDILDWTDARVLWWQPYGSSVILSRGVVASDPGAIAKRTVGAIDDQTGELVRICGGTSRRVAPADVFAALRDGTIQAAAIDIMNVREHKLWQVADTITNLRHAPSLFLVVISEAAWKRLTPEQHDILSELAQDSQSYMWARFATVRAETYAFAREKGMRVVDLSTSDLSAWRACSAPLLESYLERAGDAGPKLFTAYGKLRTNECCREAPEATPPDEHHP
jgi:C4-dicarboxylate-binding protein DctP